MTDWQEELKKKFSEQDFNPDSNSYGEPYLAGNFGDLVETITSLLERQREIIAENDGFDCGCGNVGYEVYRNEFSGEPEQRQCSYCALQKASKFRILNAPEPEPSKE